MKGSDLSRHITWFTSALYSCSMTINSVVRLKNVYTQHIFVESMLRINNMFSSDDEKSFWGDTVRRNGKNQLVLVV